MLILGKPITMLQKKTNKVSSNQLTFNPPRQRAVYWLTIKIGGKKECPYFEALIITLVVNLYYIYFKKIV